MTDRPPAVASLSPRPDGDTGSAWNVVEEAGLVRRATIGGIVGRDWSFEAGDRHSFVNPLESSVKTTFATFGEEEDEGGHAWTVRMAEGGWKVRRKVERPDDATLRVLQELHVEKPSLFQDFVARFVFAEDGLDRATIGGRTVVHGARNVYYQMDAREARLIGKSETLTVTVERADVPEAFQLEMYVRDAPGEWAVHVRLMPRKPYAFYWFRWKTRWFSLGLGPRVSRLLAGNPLIGPFFWRRSERTGRRPNMQWQGIARLEPGSRAALDIRIRHDRI